MKEQIKKERHAVDIEIEGADPSDYPKFCDAFISSASWSDTGENLTESELEELNEDHDHIHELAFHSFL